VQSIETERFRESHGLRKSKGVRKRLKTEVVGEGAPEKRKAAARLHFSNACLPKQYILDKINTAVKEKYVRFAMGRLPAVLTWG
jgi:hypothetical protein